MNSPSIDRRLTLSTKCSKFKLNASKSTQVKSDEYIETEDSVKQKMASTILNGVQPKQMHLSAIKSKFCSSEEQSPLLPELRHKAHSNQFLSAQATHKTEDFTCEPITKSLTGPRLVLSNKRAPGPFKANLCVPTISKPVQPTQEVELPEPMHPPQFELEESEEEFLTPAKLGRRESYSPKFSRASTHKYADSGDEMDLSSGSEGGAVCLNEARRFNPGIELNELTQRPRQNMHSNADESQSTPSEESEINNHHEIETNKDVERLLEQVPELIAFRERKRQEYMQLCAHQRRISAMRASGTSIDLLKFPKFG